MPLAAFANMIACVRLAAVQHQPSDSLRSALFDDARLCTRSQKGIPGKRHPQANMIELGGVMGGVRVQQAAAGGEGWDTARSRPALHLSRFACTRSGGALHAPAAVLSVCHDRSNQPLSALRSVGDGGHVAYCQSRGDTRRGQKDLGCP
eukprot:7391649-Prymnesium_polylepis.2